MAAMLFRSSQLFAKLGLRASVPAMCVVPNRAKSKQANKMKLKKEKRYNRHSFLGIVTILCTSENRCEML